MPQDKALLTKLDATIKQSEKELDGIDAERIAAIEDCKSRARSIMAVRTQAIAQRELHLRENPTPIVGLPNQERMNVLRAQAGVAVVKIAGANV